MKALVRIVGGANRVKEIYDNYVKEIKEYNNQIKHTGFYLMPVRKTAKKNRKDPSKVKYNYYYGRYWYLYISTKERGIYVYVGKEKPLESLPDPPKNPLEGVEIIYDGDDILIPEDQFEKVKDLFKGYTRIVESSKKR